jgi:hypothetical protein
LQDVLKVDHPFIKEFFLGERGRARLKRWRKKTNGALMENRSHALTTGFFTITLLIAAILFGLWFNRDRVERVPYQIATALSVPGLNPQAPVRYRGLDVGKVGGIAFDPQVAGPDPRSRSASTRHADHQDHLRHARLPGRDRYRLHPAR